MIFFSGTEFINNRSQSDRLPVEMRFPNSVKKLNITVKVRQFVLIICFCDI